MDVPLLSFFTGGGLFDIGFKQAGFRVVWTNEIYEPFVDMYSHAMSGWLSSLNGHKAKAKISNTASIEDLSCATVIKEAFGATRPKVFGMIGGPPCPDFSNGGRHAGGKGTNGRLTEVFAQMICRLNPSFFVIENVAGLYRFKKHREFLKKQVAYLRRRGGYVVDYKILNALELGVPQNRERLFIVGFRKALANRAVGRRLRKREVGWFPWPIVDAYVGAKALPWPTTSKFGKTPNLPEQCPVELTVYPALFGNGNPEKIANGRDVFTAHSKKFKLIREGDVAQMSFKRLHRFRYSPTAWYGHQEVHLHPTKPRRLSVREALRIQTVPDEYVLPAGYSLSAKFKMVCNGVPCLMAHHLAKAVGAFLVRATQ